MGRRKASNREKKFADEYSQPVSGKRKMNPSDDDSVGSSDTYVVHDERARDSGDLKGSQSDLVTIVGKYTEAISELSQRSGKVLQENEDELPISFATPVPQGHTLLPTRTISVDNITPQTSIRLIAENPVTDLSIAKVSDDSEEDANDSKHDLSRRPSSLFSVEQSESEVDPNDENVTTAVNDHVDEEEDEFADMPPLEPITPPLEPVASPPPVERMAGVDYDNSCNQTRGTLDGLPCYDDPRLPSRDILCLLQEPRLIPTYTHLPLLLAVTNYIQFGRTSTTTPYRGVSIDNFLLNSSAERVHFFMRVIQFVCYGAQVANLSRCNPFCKDLRMEILKGDNSYQPNEFLTFDHQPLLCISLVVVVLSNLSEPRLINGPNDEYAIKDVRVQFLKHEYERMISFIGAVSGSRVLYVNGVATGDPLIGISTRFTKLKTLRDRNFGSLNTVAIPADNYESPQSTMTIQEPRTNVLSKYVLFPSDEVPIYDLSGLTFDFENDFNNMDEDYVKLRGEIRRNSRCIAAYYPSIWRRQDKTIVSLNIKWIGVIDP